MREKINEEVSVVWYYSARRRQALPYTIWWQNREYVVGKIGYQHSVKDGATLHHIFEFVDKEQTLHFRLNLDTSNLHCILVFLIMKLWLSLNFGEQMSLCKNISGVFASEIISN
jgi:hypothetical protein